MAKVGKRTGVLYRRRTMSGLKRVGVEIGVSRVEKNSPDGLRRLGMETGSKAFVACVHFKTGGWVRIARGYEPTKMHNMCSYGKNPRAAIASAMRKAAGHVSKRGGAFAAWRG